ncbi:hypothetical protein [Inhella sp.]|uniref:hypothetical protein n=1 Tax=Inhella sp. TaxID=1921806 RepID=UPI0035B1EB3F
MSRAHRAPTPPSPFNPRSATSNPDQAEVLGKFVLDDGESWYRIDGVDHLPPFFMSLAGDSDLWAFISSAGSLSAGRRDEDGAFLPYETVDKIHNRWEHTGPRTWIRVEGAGSPELWEPFARSAAGTRHLRSLWKNLSGTRIRFRELHAGGDLCFEYEWFAAEPFGLVRSARLSRQADAGKAIPLRVSVLDGLLNLLPPGIGARTAATMSNLTDAYKWNETAAGGRLGLFTLYAQIWDRAEPKESFEALVAWHAGLPATARTLLSAHQVEAFCRSGHVESETLTRGRRGAFLVQFDTELDREGCAWHLVVDGPRSQTEAFELAQHLAQGGGSVAELLTARARNTAGVNELLAAADGFQQSGDPMAAAHHRANVLFNIMRGGAFVNGTCLQREDLLAFARQRHHALGDDLAALLAPLPSQVERSLVLEVVRASGQRQLERLVMEYLPLSFSRRHGDPSRPWNRFSIRVRDAQGQRVVNYQGNWRDIFQNWEALAASEPAYLGSMITAFLGAMSADGYNPYRIGREGIDWEVVDAHDPWSHIGYWGDHQIIYLLRLMEAAEAHDPTLLADLWNRSLFSFADIPYRLKPHAEQMASPKHTIDFDERAHERAHERRAQIGADGLLVCDDAGEPLLATLGEKLAVILLAKAGSLLPGGGLWLHTQRPEWNDANNALVGNGLSVVTLAHLRRLLGFLLALPAAREGFAVSEATLGALQQFGDLVSGTPIDACDDAVARRRFLDAAGDILDRWRASAYRGAPARRLTQAAPGLLVDLARSLLPLVDASLRRCKRGDGLYDSYTLVAFSAGKAEVSRLYPMLEGQVALMSCGLLSLGDAVDLLDALFASPIYCPVRRSFMLYPDRQLPGFFERNRLDAQALALPVVQQLLAQGRSDLLQQQSDGTVRFAPKLSNRADLEAAGQDLGEALKPLAEAYERVLRHHEFTGRSGTMFAYEGLGCIYWHMVAKLLLAVQERVFEAFDSGAPELAELVAHYRRVRDGLGYRKTVAEYGAFPADPYSHTAGEGGAQQPGMTGQVKEEILTRWGELGLRKRRGCVQVDPVLLDEAELPAGGELRFTWAQVPFAYRRGPVTKVRVRTEAGWVDCAERAFDPTGVLAVEVEIAFKPR